MLQTLIFVTVAFHFAQADIWPCNGDGFAVDIYSRDEWGAREPNCIDTMPTPVEYIFIHHTEGSECSSVSECGAVLRGIQNYHMDTLEWCDIGYNFLIGGDGNVYMGRGWDRVGAHTPNYNALSVAFSLMGNFENFLPSSTMLSATEDLIACAVDRVHVTSDYSLHGHRDAVCTSCPGTTLYTHLSTWDRWHAKEVIYDC